MDDTTIALDVNRIYIKLSAEQFRAAFLSVTGEMVSGNVTDNESFIVNDDNREVINQIYYYMVGSKKFDGNHKKGLLLAGGYGTGKTTMVKAMVRIIEHYSPVRFRFIPCVSLADEIKSYGLDFFKSRPIILDELGRESKVVKDYGTERHPVQEMLAMRYNSRAWTFGTTNFNMESFKKFYGGYIEDRIKEMFNIIELTGNSFRQ